MMNAGKMLHEVAPGRIEHEHLTRFADAAMRPHDADHLGLTLVLPHVLKEGLLPRAQWGRAPGVRAGHPRRSWLGGRQFGGGAVGGCRHGIAAVAAVERHRGHLRRHRRHVCRATDRGERFKATAGVDVSIDEGQPRLLELFVDRRQGREEPLVVGRVGGVADADQRAVGSEQPAAAAALDRLAGHLQVCRSEILVDGGDPALERRGVGPAVAADGDDRIARLHDEFR